MTDQSLMILALLSCGLASALILYRALTDVMSRQTADPDDREDL